MRIRLLCPNPKCARSVHLSIDPAAAALSCPHCGQSLDVNMSVVLSNGLLTRCPCCGGEECYLRKDFPRRLGLLVVVLVALLSCYFFARGQLGWALGVLVALVVVDVVIYRLLPTVTVCYRCQAEFRGLPLNPAHHAFDLATAEKYRDSPPRHGDTKKNG